MFKIYLSGGMTGLSLEAQKKWRRDIKNHLRRYEDNANQFSFFDPTEYDISDFLEAQEDIEKFSINFDLRQLMESNLVICNVSSNPFSVGTNIELGAAHNMNIPIIIYNPDKKELHPWHSGIAELVSSDMSAIAEIIKDFYLM